MARQNNAVNCRAIFIVNVQCYNTFKYNNSFKEATGSCV